MDLVLLRDNFNAGEYATYEQMLMDLQIIWDNCKLYNYPGMHKLASCMERTCKREIKKFMTKMNLDINVP